MSLKEGLQLVDANLNTSSLYYDALVSSVILGKELNINPQQLNNYKTQSENLRKAIENLFWGNSKWIQNL